jgi:hypothetical protein
MNIDLINDPVPMQIEDPFRVFRNSQDVVELYYSIEIRINKLLELIYSYNKHQSMYPVLDYLFETGLHYLEEMNKSIKFNKVKIQSMINELKYKKALYLKYI